VLEFFAGPKHRHAVGADGNYFAGFGIPGPLSTLAGTDLERPESAQFDHFVICQAFLDFLEKLIHNVVNVLSIYTQPLVDAFYDLCFGQFTARQNLTYHTLGPEPKVICYSPWSEFSILCNLDFFLSAVFR
jgi:hypothetical protein